MPGLNDSLVQKLRENNLKYFFPVQRQVIPHLLHRNPFYRPADLCVSAPTGSGKTLAFVLPLVQLLSKRIVPRVRALVLLPVQDLAAQVFKVFQAYAGNHLRVKLISGQKSFAQEQMELVVACESGFHSLADIIVATPGRLVDHIQVCNFGLFVSFQNRRDFCEWAQPMRHTVLVTVNLPYHDYSERCHICTI